MPVNTYPDGFPMTPNEAIDFSYFLSEAEKQEWRDWLQSATVEQQNELVDILHSMWQDNQKNAVPDSFANNSNQAPIESKPAEQAPSFQNIPTQQNPQPAPQNLNFAPAQPVEQFAPIGPSYNPNFAPIPSASVQSQGQGGSAFGSSNPPFQQPAPQREPTFDNNFAQSYEQSFAPVSQPGANQGFGSAQNQPFGAYNYQDTQSLQSPVSQSRSNTPPPFSVEDQTPTEPPKPAFTGTTFQPEPYDFGGDRNNQPSSQAPVAPSQNPDYPHEDWPKDTEEEEINLKNLVRHSRYTPNPILDDNTPPPDEFVYRGVHPISETQAPEPRENRDARKSDSRQKLDYGEMENEAPEKEVRSEDKSRRDIDESKSTAKKAKTSPQTDNNSKKDEFSLSKNMRTQGLLNEMYKEYLQTYDANKSQYTKFMDKITQVLSNFDQIGDIGEYVDSAMQNVMQKVVKVNDTVIGQAKDIQYLKNNTQTRGSSLQDQIDDLRYDLDKIGREIRDLKTELRRNQDEISQQVAAIGADAYRQDGMLQRMDIMRSEIMQLKQKLGVPISDQSGNSQGGDNRKPNTKSNLDLRGGV